MTTVVIGTCPRCNTEWSVQEARKYTRVDEVIGMWSALNSGNGIRCSYCHRLITKEHFAGRGKKPFKRSSQIRLLNDEGKVVFVYYGPTADIKRELSQNEVNWPDGFKGNGDDLANRMGISVDDLAARMGMSEEELSEARFDVGTSELEKA